MEPVAIIAAAVAVGASEGVRETSKQVIIDAYAALRDWLTSKYGSLVAELTGLEKEPEENLRRALLAKKLAGAGANEDVRLCDLAQTLLNLVDELEPHAAPTVGVYLRRAAIEGDIEIAGVAVEGGDGVVAEDVFAGGSLRIGGVSARKPQEPPHPSAARRR